ncbi:pyridoxal phosphate-dependent aminotransferase [Sulfurirhabdus autotrophica]|uniref:Aminotransferase n=1 Tax=Sulfurirhabdus autotrophica TaxID=1706046 RepID=A0A4R3XS94_9PROT|nr:pyridoxal phosphate-dependent aminotransferase [Sulfurirhabdus autotrophica]TCV81106.1 aspartate/methionine/tyrosine aminotransferase [Sulfurirhabdus autotrophica]
MSIALNNSRVAHRMGDIQPFYVMDILARARELEAQGKSIVHMEIGEPDFLTPQPIINAGVKAIATGSMFYTPALGLPALRSAIAGFYRDRYNLDLSPSRIIITPGSSGALLLTMGVLLNPGDQVLMADPGYPCNRHFVRFTEGQAVGVPVDASTGYQLTPELIDQHWTPQTVAVMLASPSNPTGTLIPPETLRAIAELVKSRGGKLIVDEIYHGLVYEGEAATALAISDELFVINSFSKYFGMTGWRLGWLVAPDDYEPVIDKLAQNIFLAPSTPAQYAALAAFTPETREILEDRRQQFKARRDYLLPALRELGFDIPVTPQGAFYLYAGCNKFTDDSFTFARDLLENAGVAITPGLDFGSHLPSRHVRFAYTTSLDNLKIGVNRLKQLNLGR